MNTQHSVLDFVHADALRIVPQRQLVSKDLKLDMTNVLTYPVEEQLEAVWLLKQ